MTMGTVQGDINYTSVELNKPYDDALAKPNKK